MTELIHSHNHTEYDIPACSQCDADLSDMVRDAFQSTADTFGADISIEVLHGDTILFSAVVEPNA